MTAHLPPKDPDAGIGGTAGASTVAGAVAASASMVHTAWTPQAALAAFVNHVLGQHPWARQRLRACAGRTLQAAAGPLIIQWVITPAGLVAAPEPGMGAQTGSHQGFPADVSREFDVNLSVPLGSLPLFAVDLQAAIKQVRIEGDAGFAEVLAQLLREVRWDAEDDLARITGGAAAHRAAQGARALQATAATAVQRLQEMSSAFLIDEEAALVRARTMAQFAREVGILRDDCARLEKRLEFLGAQVPGRGVRLAPLRR